MKHSTFSRVQVSWFKFFYFFLFELFDSHHYLWGSMFMPGFHGIILPMNYAPKWYCNKHITHEITSLRNSQFFTVHKHWHHLMKMIPQYNMQYISEKFLQRVFALNVYRLATPLCYHKDLGNHRNQRNSYLSNGSSFYSSYWKEGIPMWFHQCLIEKENPEHYIQSFQVSHNGKCQL